MSKKYKANGDVKTGILRHLGEDTKQGIAAVFFFAITIFLILSASPIETGPVGERTFLIFKNLFGIIGYFLLPLATFLLSISFIRHTTKNFALPKIFGTLIFFLSGLGIINLLFTAKGGVVGEIVSYPFERLFDFYVSVIFLLAFLISSMLIIFDTRVGAASSYLWKHLFGKKSEKDSKKDGDKTNNTAEIEPIIATQEKDSFKGSKETAKEDGKKTNSKNNGDKLDDDKEFAVGSSKSYGNRAFVPPPLSLLDGDKGKPGVGDIKANANIIKRTLQNFGINVEMDEISIGPSVTRYALKPAEGVKLSRIVGLQNDLALALAAHPIRIEAPIPGKSLVGIEIPNSTKTIVGLGGLLSADDYQKSEKPLLFALGKGVSGRTHFANLGKAPHLLIAGATGSGKSVTIHVIVTSLLYRNSPENMKLMLIDPKRVELTLYNNIPHLLTQVITDAKKTILALKWAAKEMDRRYDVLEAESCRDIDSYHKNILEPEVKKMEEAKKNGSWDESRKLPETMPFIIIIIDELADIMQTYPRELESAVVRLAQMSRAVGIHLILSTQRPSVNVVTGLIKANIPSRIALQVASQIDSRTILDTGGAEKLLGAGDMLYMSGEMSKPVRIQSSFISENEVKKVVKYFSSTYQNDLPSEINLTGQDVKNSIFDASLEEDSLQEEDELYEKAREMVVTSGKASTSYLQRRLGIGYSRAAKLIDMLEERGVVGPPSGSRPREVLEKADGNVESASEFGNSDQEQIDKMNNA